MGYLTPDPKKGDEQQPGGGSGLVVDLGLKACPQCRREVPDWEARCPACGIPPVPKGELPSLLPDIPAHLLVDEEEEEEEA